ncbi:MAG: patatin-like phospholipase family protein [Pirellulales bacterium]
MRKWGEAWLLARWRLWICLTVSGYLATQYLPALLAACWPSQFETLNTLATPQGMLDFQMARTSGVATVMMDVWGPAGRRSAWVNLAGDIVLICGYGPLFMAWLIGVARRVSAISRLGGFLGHLFAYGQLLAAVCDSVEDLLLAWTLWHYSPVEYAASGPVLGATLCATAKFFLLLAGLLYLVIAAGFLREVRDFLGVAWTMRFCLFASGIPAILILSPQAQEALRVHAENLPSAPLPSVALGGAALLFAFTTWYWSRALRILTDPQGEALPNSPPPSDLRSFTVGQAAALAYLPTFCLLCPLVLTSSALLFAARSLPAPSPPVATEQSRSPVRPQLANNTAMLAAAGFLDASGDRPATVYSAIRTPAYVALSILALVGLLLALVLGVVSLWSARRWAPVAQLGIEARWQAVGRRQRLLLQLTSVPGGLLFAVVGLGGPAGCLWTRFLGAPAVLLVATALIVPLGNTLVIYGHRSRLPLTLLALLAAALFSLLDLNDNHEIRRLQLDPSASPPNEERRDIYPSWELSQSFREWLQGRDDRDQFITLNERGEMTGSYPVFFVAAEGGGIRAAYQTALVLATLQDAQPTFARHTFCVSGVSGGSVGGAVYAALTAEDDVSAGNWRSTVDSVLSHDLLSPLIATSLSPDLGQRFLPWPVARFDRARSLEYALEAAWREGARDDDDQLAQSLYAFCHDFPRRQVPALFFNTTDVTTGERVAVSTHWILSSAIEPLDDGNLPAHHPDALPGLPTLAEMFYPDNTSLPLSTAAVLSARFPFVTPSGYLAQEPGTSASNPIPRRRKRRFVDGGYFDNSGLATIEDILVVLRSEKAPFPWHPVILRIGFGGRATVLETAREEARRARRSTGNEPATSVEPPLPTAATAEFQQWQQVATRTSVRGASAPLAPAPGPSFEELLTPLRTLWQTWDGHGLTEYRKFKMRLEEHRSWRLIEFSFWEYSQPLPLGWLLSQAAREDLQWQVAGFNESGQPHAAETLAAQIQRAAQETDATLNERHLADVLSELQPRPPANR